MFAGICIPDIGPVLLASVSVSFSFASTTESALDVIVDAAGSIGLFQVVSFVTLCFQ